MAYPVLPSPGKNTVLAKHPDNRWSPSIPITNRELWVPLRHEFLDQSHLDDVLAADPWTGKTQSNTYEYLYGPPYTSGKLGTIRDTYIGYLGAGYRYFTADWNNILGPTYGGWPKQDRFYEFLTDPSEPFPSYYGTSEPYEWWSLSYTPGYTGGHGGSVNPMSSWFSVGNWRRYSDGGENINTGYYYISDDAGYHTYKWVSAGMTWCDNSSWGGGFFFDFGMARKTHAGYTVGMRVHRLGEETLSVCYEDLDPAALNPDYLDYLPTGWDPLGPSKPGPTYPYGLVYYPATQLWLSGNLDPYRGSEPEWATPLYTDGHLAFDVTQNRRQTVRTVRFSDATTEILDWRMVLRLRKAGTYKHLTPGTDAGQIDRYEIYTGVGPDLIYPWDPAWSGTKVGDLTLTWGSYTSGNGHSDDGHIQYFDAFTDPSVSWTGATVTPFTDPANRPSPNDWWAFHVTGVTPYDFASGDYSEITIVPYGYFHEPPCAAALIDGGDGVGDFYASCGLEFSIEWEAQIRLPEEFKTLWSGQIITDDDILRFTQRNDGLGTAEGHARMAYYLSSVQGSNRQRGDGQGTYL